MKRKTVRIIGLCLIALALNTKVIAKYIKNDHAKIADIEVEKTFSITINYIDTKSNILLESEKRNRIKQGENYNYIPKEIEGYYVYGDSGNTSGVIDNFNIEINYYYRPNGVFAKVYDTTGNEKIDTLVLNNNPNFTYTGTLINDFENQDNNDYQQNSSNNIPIWHSTLNQVISVIVLDNIKPLDYTTRWFEYGYNIEKIDGLEKISTDEVKNMMLMFKHCEKLKNIDLSNMNTSKVENMIGLFYRCFQLENVNLSNLDTSKVTSLDVMFTNCEKLSKINLSNFDTRNVTRMESVFCNCISLIDINISSFNTEKVTTMIDMFSCCNKLKNLDISTFDTKNVNNMYGMFYKCSEIKTIYIGSNWNTNKVTNSSIMFSGDYKLVGEKGTRYNGNYVDKTYAHEDGGTKKPGYLTMKRTNKYDVWLDEDREEKNIRIESNNNIEEKAVKNKNENDYKSIIENNILIKEEVFNTATAIKNEQIITRIEENITNE